MTKQVNCIFAVHFDDDQDPRYKALTELLMSAEMWTEGNLITALHCDSKDEMIEIVEGKDESV